MLSEEEKQAIEKLNKILKQWQEIINIEDPIERDIEMSLYVEDMPFEEIEISLNLINKLQKENDMLKNHIHYKKCENCEKEYKSKRSDSKYCSECAKTVNNKNWYKSLTEEQKSKRREQSKNYMRKMRKTRKEKIND